MPGTLSFYGEHFSGFLERISPCDPWVNQLFCTGWYLILLQAKCVPCSIFLPNFGEFCAVWNTETPAANLSCSILASLSLKDPKFPPIIAQFLSD
jgi:hypothetical protein